MNWFIDPIREAAGLGVIGTYALALSLALLGLCALAGLLALVVEWLRPDLATHARYNRMLLGRLPATRGNRVRMSLNYILTAVFYFMAVNFYFLPALLAFLAWLPLLVWVLRASLAARTARAG